MGSSRHHFCLSDKSFDGLSNILNLLALLLHSFRVSACRAIHPYPDLGVIRRKRILQDVSGQALPGRMLAILGPSGRCGARSLAVVKKKDE